MISHIRLPLFSRAYIEKIGEPGDEATHTHTTTCHPCADHVSVCACVRIMQGGKDLQHERKLSVKL